MIIEGQYPHAEWGTTVDAIEAALARGETPELPLPLVGITLLPPWWWLILWAGKRIENRAPSVAGRLQGWRGLIALTSSKPSKDATDMAFWDLDVVIRRGLVPNAVLGGRSAEDLLKVMAAHQGCVVAVAELSDVVVNNRVEPDAWAVAGQRGLVLGRVIEVEPVPCSGGRGVFRFGACSGCGKPGAIENKGVPLVCRACKATTWFDQLGRPMLKVRSVQPGNIL